MLRLSLMTMSMFIPVIIKIKMEQDMEDALELYGEMLDLAADAGFEAVDVTSMELDMIGKETVKEYLEARGLKVSSLIYSNQFASTDEEKCREIVEGGKNAVEQAIYLETKVLMLVPQVHEGIEQFSAEEVQRALIGNLTPVTAYAVEKGIHSVIEDTPDLRLHLCRAEDLARVVDAIPGQEVVYDSGNMVLVDEDPIKYYERFAQKTAHIHLKDMMEVPETARFADTAADGRKMTGAPSGTGMLAEVFPTLMKRVRENGYDGYLTVEFAKDEELGYPESLKRAKTYFDGIISDSEISVRPFFDSLEMREDRENGHCYGIYMREALQAFAAKGTKQTAGEVYETFLDCYKHTLSGDDNFVDLLDILRGYEENAALLIDKQRDHYVHSVNVFLLGIRIYQNSENFRKATAQFLGQKGELSFSGVQEEFFFRWGMAALFHDIGYPVEITNNQLRKFIRTVLADEKRDAEPYIGYHKEDCLTELPCRDQKLNFTAMLSRHIADTLDVREDLLENTLAGFVADMQSNGHVDHGYYSALALLQHYGFMAEGDDASAKIYREAVLDAASAILLHNYYKHVLQKPPFALPPLSAERHPIGYLLILCDELQEWNRQAYGIEDKKKVHAADCKIRMDAGCLKVHYVTYGGVLAEDFCAKKERTLRQLLVLDNIFPGGVTVSATTRSDILLSDIRSDREKLPRPFLENVEKLSRRIHERYNEAQRASHPDRELQYPDWESLSDDLKYSNIRQARAYFGYLQAAGMYAAPEGDAGQEVLEFPPELTEALARKEHESWIAERTDNGWKYGAEKDVQKKLSPYLIPYDELPEDVRQMDRDAIDNILPLFHEIGLRVYRMR